MKTICVYTFLLLVVCSTGCKEKTIKEKEADYVNEMVNNLPVERSQYKWLVLLPGLGCHGCIQEAEMFMQQNIGNNNILFVLTKVESLKILQNKINIRLNEHSNVYLDKDNTIRIPSDNSIYPCIVQLKNGEPDNYQFQAPYNSQAFARLETQVDTKQTK